MLFRSPAYRLTVVCHENKREELSDILFQETTTIGLRYRYEQRTVLKREIVEKETPYGIVHFKKVTHKNEIYYYPEYEDVKAIALKNNISIQHVFDTLKNNV